MIMHVKSKRHHARNRRKLKSCLWVDVKVTLITKLISKNVSNFCSGIKKRTEADSYLALLTFPLDSCHLYCGVQAAGGGRALRSTDAKRGVRSGVHNPSHTLPTVAGNCPPLLWFQNRAPIFCPEQLVQSCVLQVGVEQAAEEPLRYILPSRVDPLLLLSLEQHKAVSGSQRLVWASACFSCDLCWDHEMPEVSGRKFCQ